ncbi:MAG: topoisomerase DNA-binding C4 zinc finger domain-containing protein, partial [Clostridia bacterium]|nr:topoisomerase DNA-binding C4 zinc finger domain-containing protein [Clostridia bacterium]
ERFVASQMKNALFDTVLCRFKSGDYVFHSGGYTVKFRGFMAVSGDVQFEDESDEENGMRSCQLPVLKVGESLPARKILPQQHFTTPPARYTEGTLTKAMADMGIGRPSTFAPTIATIITRKYVKHEGKYLVPTSIGELTTKLMKEAFTHIIDYNYTAEMEEELEDICSGKIDYIKVLHSFYDDFIRMLDKAYETVGDERITVPPVQTDLICEKCGAVMVEKEGKFGKFAACPNYPACRNTKQLGKEKAEDSAEAKEVIAEEKCPNCGSDMILKKGKFGSFYACRNYPECKTTMQYRKDIGIPCPKCGKKLVIKQTRTKRRFYSCEDYPNCDFSCWDIPQKEKCPRCGSMLLKRKTKDEYYCSNSSCEYKTDKLS